MSPNNERAKPNETILPIFLDKILGLWKAQNHKRFQAISWGPETSKRKREGNMPKEWREYSMKDCHSNGLDIKLYSETLNILDMQLGQKYEVFPWSQNWRKGKKGRNYSQ